MSVRVLLIQERLPIKEPKKETMPFVKNLENNYILKAMNCHNTKAHHAIVF